MSLQHIKKTVTILQKNIGWESKKIKMQILKSVSKDNTSISAKFQDLESINGFQIQNEIKLIKAFIDQHLETDVPKTFQA